MEQRKDSIPPYEVERFARRAERPGFRLTELQIGPSQKIPWHPHTSIQDPFRALRGRICVSLRAPDEEIHLASGEICTVSRRRPHRATNAGEGSASFLILQGSGEYDFAPLA